MTQFLANKKPELISRASRYAPLLGPFLLSATLFCLWIGRGYNVTGWEILGAADAGFWLDSYGLIATLEKYWWQMRHYQYWTIVSSPFFSISAGLFSNLLPWPLWPQLLMLLSAVTGFFLYARALDLAPRSLFLVIAASGPLTSYFLVGHPYIAGTYTYMLAIPWVLSHRQLGFNLKRTSLELLFWTFTYFFSLNFYEAGRSYLIVPALAALFLPEVPRSRRILWFFVSFLLWVALYRWNSYTSEVTEPLKDIFALITSFPFIAIQIIKSYCAFRLDFPTVAILTLLSVFLLDRKHRFFWLSLLVANFGTLVLIGKFALDINDPSLEQLRPRRTIVFSFISVTIIALALRDASERSRRFLSCAIFCGALIVLLNSFWRILTPIQNKALPFMDSEADYFVDRTLVAYSTALAQFIYEHPGEHFILYGYSAYPENTTDPVALPEREYLLLGPKIFRERVTFISDPAGQCRYSCLPMHSKDEISGILHTERDRLLYVHIPSGSWFTAENASAPDQRISERLVQQFGQSVQVELGFESQGYHSYRILNPTASYHR